MGFFKETGESIFKYSEKLVNKTEQYAKIAKFNIDIKRFESNINSIQNEIGEYVIEIIDKGQENLNLSEKAVSEKYSKIKEIRISIEAKREEIEQAKKEKPSDNAKA